MGRLSNWQPVIPGLGEGLDFLDRGLTSRRDYELKRQAEEQKGRFENEQNAAIMAGKREQERRDKIKEAQDQAERRMKVTSNLAALLGKKRYSEAQALAGASQFEDPNRPGQMGGVQLAEEADAAPPAGVGPPPEPGPAAPPPNPLAGFLKLRPPEQPGPGPAAPGDEAAPQLRQPFAAPQVPPGPQLTLPDAQPDAAAQPAPAAGKRYRVSFPGGQSTVIDSQEAERAAKQEAEDKASQLEAAAASETNPDTRAAFMRQAGLIRSQISNADKAPITNTAGQENSQDFKRERDERNQLTREEQLRKAALGGSNRDNWRRDEAQKRGDFAEGNYAHGIATKVLQEFGFHEMQVANRKFNNMSASLAASPNAALDATISGSFVKMAQGGTGVISDKDMAQFWNRIGSLGLKTEQEVEDVLSGKIVSEKRAEVATAVHELAQQAQQNLRMVRDQMDFAYRTDPVIANNPQWRTQALGTYFPEEREKADATGAPAPPPRSWQPGGGGGRRSTPRGPVPGSPAVAPPQGGPPPPAKAPPSLDAAIQDATDRYRKNPNDKLAADFLRKAGRLK